MMIDLSNITKADKKAILDLLVNEVGDTYEIYIPKSTQQFFSSNQDIALDYAWLAYSGHKLKEVADEFEYADDFEYDTVSPTHHASVLFKVKPFNIEYLAQAILEISYGYENEHEDEQFAYIEDVNQYLYEVEQSEIEPACPEFIEYYLDFREEYDEDEEDE